MSHDATGIPIKGRKLMSASYYQGGVTVVDFTDMSNSGLDRRPAGSTNNRGLDVYRLTGALGRLTAKAKRWSHSNPQTQEAWQAP